MHSDLASRFAVVLDVQVDNPVVQAGLDFDATFQINNPRDDPYSASSWFIILGNGDFIGLTSVVRTWKSASFQWGTNFTIWWQWNQYVDAVSHISGLEKAKGIFYAQGTINIPHSMLFAVSPQFWYKVGPTF